MSDKNSLTKRIEDVERDALIGCGLSDVLYERRVQDAYALILAQSSEDDHAETELVLRQRGFDPEFTPRIAGTDECCLTGIDVNCCPCGQHP